MDEEFGARIQEFFERLPAPLRDPKKLVLGLAILAIIFWGLFLRPRPGTLTITVERLDSGEKVAGATVELTAPDGRVEQTEYSDNAGRVVFSSVGSGTEYGVFVDPGQGYETETEYFSIESGEAASLSVEVARDYGLELSVEQERFSVGAGCKARIPVEVVNGGEEPAEVELVTGGGLKSWPYESAKTTVGAKEARQLVIEVGVPEGEEGGASGEVRAKYTDEGVKIGLEVVGDPEVDVSPKSISKSLSDSENSFIETIEFSLEDAGNLEMKVECKVVGSDLESKARITPTDDLLLKEGNPKLFKAELGPFSSGKHIGKIICDTGCGEYTLLVEIDK